MPRQYTRWIFGGAVLALATSLGVAFEIMGHRRAPFQDVAERSAESVFLVAVEDGTARTPLGTAFAVKRDGVLATTAQIAAELDRRGALGGGAGGNVRAVAVQSDTSTTRRIVSAATAPEWQPGSLEHDVALLQLDAGPSLAPLPIANLDVQDQIVRGTPNASLGFPAKTTDAARPRVNLSVDVVRDVRPGYLDIGPATAPGSSGSPVFEQNGNVIAIVSAAAPAPGSGGGAQPGASNVWAVSASVLRALLR